MLRSCFLTNYFEILSAVSKKKSKMSQPIRGEGGHLFSNRQEKDKLGRGHWDLASCQVSLNSVQRLQRRSWKCLGQLEARAAILFFRLTRKTKLGRGHWDLASCQVSLNSVQQFERNSLKCLNPIRGQGSHLVFPIDLKMTNLVEDIEILLPVKFCWILFSGFRGEVENVSAN